MWTAQFWKETIERAVKTAAQVAGGLLVGLNVAGEFDWQAFLVTAGVTIGLSFVTSILSSLAGPPNSPSLVGTIITSTTFWAIVIAGAVLGTVMLL